MNVQHKTAILIYVRFSLAQRPYAILMLYYRTRNAQYSIRLAWHKVVGPIRILRKLIWRLYAGRSLVQRSYVMHMQLMSFRVQ